MLVLLCLFNSFWQASVQEQPAHLQVPCWWRYSSAYQADSRYTREGQLKSTVDKMGFKINVVLCLHKYKYMHSTMLPSTFSSLIAVWVQAHYGMEYVSLQAITTCYPCWFNYCVGWLVHCSVCFILCVFLAITIVAKFIWKLNMPNF